MLTNDTLLLLQFFLQKKFGEIQQILWSEWVPSEWESKQLIKNIKTIHMIPVHQLASF